MNLNPCRKSARPPRPLLNNRPRTPTPAQLPPRHNRPATRRRAALSPRERDRMQRLRRTSPPQRRPRDRRNHRGRPKSRGLPADYRFQRPRWLLLRLEQPGRVGAPEDECAGSGRVEFTVADPPGGGDD